MSINVTAQNGVFRFILKSKNAMQTVTKMALIEIGRRLCQYSPVGNPAFWKNPRRGKYGYKPGLFINNWQLGVDAKPTGIINARDPSGAAAIARMTKAIPRWPMGHTYYFVNNLPYARKLEFGLHSAQVPPGGMVGRVQLEFNQILREAEIEYSKGK
jgi:hypothetical protein